MSAITSYSIWIWNIYLFVCVFLLMVLCPAYTASCLYIQSLYTVLIADAAAVTPSVHGGQEEGEDEHHQDRWCRQQKWRPPPWSWCPVPTVQSGHHYWWAHPHSKDRSWWWTVPIMDPPIHRLLSPPAQILIISITAVVQWDDPWWCQN